MTLSSSINYRLRNNTSLQPSSWYCFLRVSSLDYSSYHYCYFGSKHDEDSLEARGRQARSEDDWNYHA